MANKPSIPKGTRDFSPEEMQKRDYIFDTVRKVFKLYGYQPIETPAMENLTTLLGKYGEEGDRLIFRILNSGDFLAGIEESALQAGDTGKLSSQLCEKGLRYDLTVPFARYVVQHRDEIVFPFKRYQIQPVWRADRPQKGRYREFFQCDVDVIGSNSLLNEHELIKIIDDIFARLGIQVEIKINNRKVLAGIADYIGASNRLVDFTIALDKFEKVGWEKVKEELLSKGLSSNTINEFSNVVGVINFDNVNKIKFLNSILLESPIGKIGLQEMESLLTLLDKTTLKSKIVFDLTLARGLNYYTGAIIEVKSVDVAIGSICGGGRYDDLTGIFGLEGVSGVGVSFGADRIYDVMEQLGLSGQISGSATDVLILNFGEAELKYALGILDLLRDKGIRAELYPDEVKLKKQMSYADTRKIPCIIIAGEEEIRSEEVTVKIMLSGDQKKVKKESLAEYLTSELNLK